MKNNIDTIIFDLGRVLIDHSPDYLYRTIFNDDLDKMDWFLKNVCTPEWNIEQDAGRTIKEANKIKIEEFPEYEKEILAYYDQWSIMCNGPINGTLRIFEAIKKSNKYKYYALTNFSAETWPTAIQLFPFLITFQGIIVSGEVKMRKPFDDIYHHLFKTFDINPKNAVFIDDSMPNIKTANRLGLHGIHFQSPEQLEKDLKKLNITY
ncbi:HAD family phosphatase [Flavicella sp.]|uniref:HAD family hydrolase n=1 Tax=Flavicella sp. TaxID=2957742 RepID=UPI0030188B37